MVPSPQRKKSRSLHDVNLHDTPREVIYRTGAAGSVRLLFGEHDDHLQHTGYILP